MIRSAALWTTIAALCACAPALSGRQNIPCTADCALELTNGTTFDLDVRVTQRRTGAVVREHLGAGESRQIVLTSSEVPAVTVDGARSASMTRPLNIRVRCAVPTRTGDVFRTACQLAAVSAVPGDSVPPQPATKSVQ